MVFNNVIELSRYFRKAPIQIKCFHTDLITAHPIAVVRLDCLVCCGIQEHPGHLMRFAAEFRLFVLHIGENLIQITGMQGMHIILSLRGVCIVLGINDQDLIASGQHNVTLHDWEQGADTVIQRPLNLRCCRCYLRTFLGVILQYKFLIQSVHALLVDEGSQSVIAGVRGQQHSFEDQLAQTNEHTIGIVVPLKPNG